MKFEKAFLNPARPLIDEVVAWLFPRVRRVEGAPSLAHLMVVVPTAQSGRNLRLALARKATQQGWGGILPPRVVQPMSLVRPQDKSLPEATETEIAAAFQQFVQENHETLLSYKHLVCEADFHDLTARFALLDQLEDIWRTLAGDGLLIRDVMARAEDVFADAVGNEQVRWQELAALEAGFFAYLEAHNLRYPTVSVHLAKTQAEIVDDEVEEIVLPALADPLHVFESVMRQQVDAGKHVTVLLHAAEADAGLFNEWGRPKTAAWIGKNAPLLANLTDEDIVSTGTSGELVRRVAEAFPSSKGNAALPALSVCDETLFDSIMAAFLNRDYVVHNPEKHPLSHSALGALIRNLMALYPQDHLPWRAFASLLRADDVITALKLDPEARAQTLTGLDYAQNAFLPAEVPANLTFPDLLGVRREDDIAFRGFLTQGRRLLGALEEARKDRGLTDYLRQALNWVFAEREWEKGADTREFEAASDSAREMLGALESPFITGLPLKPEAFSALAGRTFDSANYSLEPDSPQAINTEGWLELSWSEASHFALAGFHEGKIPDSIIGHPFLPDLLRKKLGLVSNDDRLARDTWLLKELLASHEPHAVRAFVARANDSGDISRPSRLMYLCSDEDLTKRIDGLFGDLPFDGQNRNREIDLPLALPDSLPMPHHFSASALDTYLGCPFTYLLKYGLKMKPYKEKDELGADDFGNLVHLALRKYAEIQIARGDNQLTTEDDIKVVLREEIYPIIEARYPNPSLNVTLQLDAVKGRLDLFAKKQAELAQQGWRIRHAEMSIEHHDTKLGCFIHGSIDRVDELLNPQEGDKRWLILDYKTWDEASKFNSKVLTSNQGGGAKVLPERAKNARAMGYTVVQVEDSKHNLKDAHCVLSVQLPVYGECYAEIKKIPFDTITYKYLILGKSAKETTLKDLPDEAIDPAIKTAAQIVKNIGDNIFWPPGKGENWRYDYGGLFVTDPETDLKDTPWVQEQSRRLAGIKKEVQNV